MIPKQSVILALSLLALSVFTQPGNAESIRLCGKRLSDLLTSICEKHGGFHAPRVRRNIFPSSDLRKPVEDILLNLVRKHDPNVASAPLSEMVDFPQGGVVDECCKKQCALTTLVSYCANARDIESIDIEEILSGLDNIPIMSDTGLSQTSPTNLGSAKHHESHPRRYAHSRPNLGLSNRNRSVFIVLPQLQQEDDDKALGEYRF